MCVCGERNVHLHAGRHGHDILLVPIHLKVHWCLAAIDCKSKNISYYDSLQEENNTCLTILRYTITWCSMSSVINVFRNYLVSEEKAKKIQASDWTLCTPQVGTCMFLQLIMCYCCCYCRIFLDKQMDQIVVFLLVWYAIILCVCLCVCLECIECLECIACSMPVCVCVLCQLYIVLVCLAGRIQL